MRIDLTKTALNDLAAIANYYEEEQQGLGKQFIDEISIKFEEIRIFPFSSRAGLKANTREKIMHRFPYTIVYTVINNSIKILTIFHQRKQYP